MSVVIFLTFDKGGRMSSRMPSIRTGGRIVVPAVEAVEEVTVVVELVVLDVIG